jgi:hypothetical protein
LIMQYREQPRTQIRPVLPKMQFAQGSRQAILDEIVGSANVARQCSRITPQARDFGLDLPVGIRHDMLPMQDRSAGRRSRERLYRGDVIR